ncbi:MAG: hypothetical protein JO043_05785 [Candidatus Eremiobacteraeota bacterium]|nr:hypothetical protein [Candidatus Eremiobacteraeota bacterium]
MAAPNRLRAGLALGVRAHSGWAAVAIAGGDIDDPVVVERSRLAMAPTEDAAFTQPYHLAATLGPERGRPIVQRCAAKAEELATAQLRRLLHAVGPQQVGTCAILTARDRQPQDLEKTLRSHALIHAAEGMLFREAVARAAVACGLDVQPIAEDEILGTAASMWRTAPRRIEQQLADLRRTLGSPWTRDEKLATLAALVSVSSDVSRKRPSPKSA